MADAALAIYCSSCCYDAVLSRARHGDGCGCNAAASSGSLGIVRAECGGTNTALAIPHAILRLAACSGSLRRSEGGARRYRRQTGMKEHMDNGAMCRWADPAWQQASAEPAENLSSPPSALLRERESEMAIWWSDFVGLHCQIGRKERGRGMKAGGGSWVRWRGRWAASGSWCWRLGGCVWEGASAWKCETPTFFQETNDLYNT
jgi:hypothetical protein